MGESTLAGHPTLMALPYCDVYSCLGVWKMRRIRVEWYIWAPFDPDADVLTGSDGRFAFNLLYPGLVPVLKF